MTMNLDRIKEIYRTIKPPKEAGLLRHSRNVEGAVSGESRSLLKEEQALTGTTVHQEGYASTGPLVPKCPKCRVEMLQRSNRVTGEPLRLPPFPHVQEHLSNHHRWKTDGGGTSSPGRKVSPRKSERSPFLPSQWNQRVDWPSRRRHQVLTWKYRCWTCISDGRAR